MKNAAHIGLMSAFIILAASELSICNAACTTTDEVVRANFLFQGTTYPVDMSLDCADAPITVNNFLQYVDSGDFDKLIINRSVSNFVIQTGGYTYDSSIGDFTYDSSTSTFNGGLQPVPNLTNPSTGITNEATAMLSNLRGTVAMARTSQPDSATNEWFINLVDNTNLDHTDTPFNSTPGYAVFGKVLGNGMSTIDNVSTIPVYDLSSDINYHGSFLDIPLINFPTGTPTSSITDSNLVEISSMSRLFSLPSLVEFQDAVAVTPQTQTITIQNYSADPISINVDTSSITGPFVVSTSTCTSNLLAAGTLSAPTSCSMQVQFNPTTTGYFTNTFNIAISASASASTPAYSYTFPVTLRTPLPIMFAKPDTIDFGAQPIYDPNNTASAAQSVIFVYNFGDKPLNLSSVAFDSQTPSDFQFIDDCIANNVTSPGQVSPGGFCVLVINFTPTDYAQKTGIITINSDDPVNGTINIPVTGGATTDTDGVDNAIEDSAPNNGDNNNDGISDKLQSYVASFPAIQNIYTSLITDSSLSFSSVASVPLSTLDPLPQGVKLGDGAFSFELSGFTAGSTVQFGLILPNGDAPTNIYSFGASSDNSTPHWYTLQNNASPGVAIIGNARLSDPSGNSVSRNLTQIQIQDGGYGDSDMQVNGKILFVGGPEITNSTSNGSGGALWLLFIMPVTIVALRKKSRSNC